MDVLPQIKVDLTFCLHLPTHPFAKSYSILLQLLQNTDLKAKAKATTGIMNLEVDRCLGTSTRIRPPWVTEEEH
jgi:hypothetical protein